MWVLATLNDLVARSKQGETQLRLLDFEDHQEKLKELHRRYVKDSTVSKERADMMKETRLAAIVLGFSKTDVRLIEPEFKARYLDRRLPDDLKGQGTAGVAAAVSIPGLNRSVRAADTQVAEARALTDSILRVKAVEAAGDKISAETFAAASRTLRAAKEAVEDALQPAGKDARVRKRKQAAPDRLNDASEDLEQCITDLVLSRAASSLDDESFDEAVIRLKDSLAKLAKESARTIKVPGDGVAWLLEVFPREES